VEDGRYDDAIEVYRAGLAGIKKVPASWILTEADLATRADAGRAMERDLVHLYLMREDVEAAEPLIRRRLDEDPGDLVLLMGLGMVLSRKGMVDEARDHYRTLLTRSDLQHGDYLSIGVSLFGMEDFSGAAMAFKRVADLHPFGRDAWFNYANALLALENWNELVAIGPKLAEVDPLGENAALILAQAHLSSEDETGAIAHFERTLLAPVHVGELRMEPLGLETIVRGNLIGNEAPVGSEVNLRFLFYSGDEILGSEILRMRAPEKEAAVEFEVRFDRSAVAYRYELIGVIEEPVHPWPADSSEAIPADP
jgi:tetratricopeptide (TPR) repeat protein